MPIFYVVILHSSLLLPFSVLILHSLLFLPFSVKENERWEYQNMYMNLINVAKTKMQVSRYKCDYL